jgi:hypothetical protein
MSYRTIAPFTSQVPEVPGNVVVLEDISQIPFPEPYRNYNYNAVESAPVGAEPVNVTKSDKPNFLMLILIGLTLLTIGVIE